MKKTLIAFFVLSVLVAACPVFAVDVSKEPTGFRGIKWDAPIKDYPNTFKYVKAHPALPGVAVYEKIKERRSFAGYQIDRVDYFFDSVGFTSAAVSVRVPSGSGLPIYNDFIEACDLQWGSGEEGLLQEPDYKYYEWQFPRSRAVVHCISEAQADMVSLLVHSIAGMDRAEEYEKERKSWEGETDF